MANWKFDKWCAEATSKIVFPPDRYAVERELRGHLLDHYEAELSQGATREEAEERTLAAMGPARDIAQELGLIHRPFWGRFHLVTRWAAIGMVCLFLFLLSSWLLKSYVLFHTFTYPEYHLYDPFEDTAAFDDAGTYRRVSCGEPLSLSFSDGYLFVLRQYALWEDCHVDTQGQPLQEETMYIRLQVISLVPWASQTDISRWFGARDDLGNVYSPAYAQTGGPYFQSSVYHTAPGVYTHILRSSEYCSRGASRLELFCTRGGREILLSMPLTEEVAG